MDDFKVFYRQSMKQSTFVLLNPKICRVACQELDIMESYPFSIADREYTWHQTTTGRDMIYLGANPISAANYQH